VYKDKEICFGEGIAWRKPSPQSYPLFQGGAGVVKVFPNPNNGQFVIDFEELVLTSLRIMDIMGKSVYHTKQANDRKISLSLPSGLYTLLVTDANGIEYHQKIVILQP
jgi:hypothetical protein